jgi:hypothetical protein
MRWPSIKWGLYSAATGGAIAIALFGILQYAARQPGLWLYSEVHRVIAILWPSAVLLMATQGIEYTFQGWSIVGLSMGLNAVLYGLIGLLLSAFRSKSGNDGDVTLGPESDV